MKEKQIYSDQLQGIYPIIGVDESGKGEYLTPLIICAVFIENHEAYQDLQKFGIGDSKKFASKKINLLATKLLEYKNILYKKIVIYPEKYNILYDKMHNMNKVLSWGHSRAIKDLVMDIDKKYIKNELNGKLYVIGDQFSTRNYLENDLSLLKDRIHFSKYTKAETHLVVAAASILSKFFVNTFITKDFYKVYQKLGYSIEKNDYEQLPIDYKDSKTFAKNMVIKYGESILKKIGKYNFKTTKEIIEDVKSKGSLFF